MEVPESKGRVGLNDERIRLNDERIRLNDERIQRVAVGYRARFGKDALYRAVFP
jgi:hypothetical protein